MQLQQAKRENVKIKLGLQGCSGSGKTYSALLLAYGLWCKFGPSSYCACSSPPSTINCEKK